MMVRPDPMRDRTELRSYPTVRAEFVEGDLLCFRGRGLNSVLIRLMTASRYSHVGLVHLFEGRVYCLEAVVSGVRLLLMSELVRRYDGGIDYFSVPEATEPQRRGAVGFGFQQLGRRYDYGAVVRFGLLLLFGARGRARPDQRWFCSELVAEAYRRQGLRLAEAAAAYTSPSDLAASPRLSFRYRLKR